MVEIDWSEVSSMSQFKDYMIFFLEGKLDNTPVYGGNIKDEHDTLQYISELKKLNKLGFITIDSQPGIYIKDINNEENNYAEHAYVEGFISKDNNIIQKLQQGDYLESMGIFGFFYNYSTSEVYYSRPYYPKELTLYGPEFKNVQTEFKFPLNQIAMNHLKAFKEHLRGSFSDMIERDAVFFTFVLRIRGDDSLFFKLLFLIYLLKCYTHTPEPDWKKATREAWSTYAADH